MGLSSRLCNRKEIGLYNILGLGKKHIGIVLLCENVFESLISLVIGLMGGVYLKQAYVFGTPKNTEFCSAIWFFCVHTFDGNNVIVVDHLLNI
ncbi:MAG TPA: FtsX-like permease family protein [Desulfosporosinus sp.]|nr:FtsX-like permease family protein [Desulfosporosinus sp.]